MAIKFYFDENMPRAPVKQLAEYNIVVVMAVDTEMMGQDDSSQLTYTKENELVIVTFDRPFAGRTMKLSDHAGLVCLSGQHNEIGKIVKVLLEINEQYAPEEILGRVLWY